MFTAVTYNKVVFFYVYIYIYIHIYIYIYIYLINDDDDVVERRNKIQKKS